MKILRLIALGVGLALAGCGTVFSPAGSVPVDQSLSPQAQNAQKAINEANLDLAAAAQTVGDDAANGVMTKAEAQAYLDKIKQAASAVKKAQTLLDAGDISNAQNQAQLISQGLLLLQKELAAKARSN